MVDGLMKVGVLAASARSLKELGRLVEGAGFAVAAYHELQGEPSVLPAVDVWVANLDLHDPLAEMLIDQLDGSGIPVIFDDAEAVVDDAAQDGNVQFCKRQRQLGCKLRQLVREPQDPVDGRKLRRAEFVWVLGASTGGPEAVMTFIKGIPADLTRIAFVYVQHTGDQALSNLRQVMARHTLWQVEFTDVPRVVREKTIYLVSPAQQVELLEGGVLSPTPETWSGPYRPSIDQVVAKVARVYGRRGGAIIFSGMGDDGAKSCTLLYHRGGSVWCQSRASCAVDSMPVSVERRGCVLFSAAPEELAQRFVNLHKFGAQPPQSILGQGTS